VDDFERYSDPNGIRNVWKDGDGNSVSYITTSTKVSGPAHESLQAMAFFYDNNGAPFYSEAYANTTGPNSFDFGMDWTLKGVKVLLGLWFHGTPGIRGSFDPNTYTITADGAGIGNVPDLRNPSRYHDEFHFGYKEATSGTDTNLPQTTPKPPSTYKGVKIIAKVESLDNTGDTECKAGVMIRDSLDANSVNGFMCVRRIAANTYGVAFQYRETAKGGSTTQEVNDSGITLPCWVAITLQTHSAQRNVRAYYSKNSTNGTDGTWYQLGPSTPPQPVQYPAGTMYLPKPGSAPLYIGLAATSSSYGEMCTADFNNVPTYAGTYGSGGAWKHQDIGIVDINNVPEPMYVALEDSSHTARWYYPGSSNPADADPNVTRIGCWTQWKIDLSNFGGVDLSDVQRMYIGFGNRSTPTQGGLGLVYIDDIRQQYCVPECGPTGDLTCDCSVNFSDFAILANEWLYTGSSVADLADADLHIIKDNKVDSNDLNIMAEHWLEVKFWPDW
jgi:hypothetical protein